MTRLFTLAVLLLAAACSSGTAPTPTTDSAGTVPDGGSGPPASAGQGGSGEDKGASSGSKASSLSVKSLVLEPPSIDSNGKTNVTATLDDGANGFTIAGGELIDPDTGASYGSFTNAGHGVFTLTLAWGDAQKAKSIDFTNGGVTRSLEARFFANNGDKASQSANLRLTCAGGSACAGTCTNMRDDTHCGACDLTCDSNYYCASANQCATGNYGVGFGYWQGPAHSCTSYCAGKGTCLSSTLSRLDGSSTSYGCDDVPPLTSSTTYAMPYRNITCSCGAGGGPLATLVKPAGKSCAQTCAASVNKKCLETTFETSTNFVGQNCAAPYTLGNADAADGSRAGTLTVPNVGTVLDCLCAKPAHRR